MSLATFLVIVLIVVIIESFAEIIQIVLNFEAISDNIFLEPNSENCLDLIFVAPLYEKVTFVSNKSHITSGIRKFMLDMPSPGSFQNIGLSI